MPTKRNQATYTRRRPTAVNKLPRKKTINCYLTADCHLQLKSRSSLWLHTVSIAISLTLLLPLAWWLNSSNASIEAPSREETAIIRDKIIRLPKKATPTTWLKVILGTG